MITDAAAHFYWTLVSWRPARDFAIIMAVQEELLYGVHQRLLGFALLFCLLIASEIGFRIGRRASAKTASDSSELGVLQGGVLGLLALLLGFTFSMSMTRYEKRKSLVIEEANAVGTARLRARTLPAAFAAGAEPLFDRYASAQAAYYAAENDVSAAPAALEEKIRGLQEEMWTRGESAAKRGRDPVAALYLSAVNELIDLHALRLYARNDHVPEPVLILLACVSAMSVLLVGYGYGISGRRQVLPLALACLIVSIVIVLIMDLDRPGRGRITISPEVLTG